MIRHLSFLLLFMMVVPAFSQTTNDYPPPVTFTAQQDHATNTDVNSVLNHIPFATAAADPVNSLSRATVWNRGTAKWLVAERSHTPLTLI